MYKFAKMSKDDKNFIFNKASLEMGLNETIIEKDFWVCLVLDYLFNKSEYKDFFIFKGGTSLSKGYNLINRFSEDVDLILNWSALGVKSGDPFEKRSNTKQDFYNKTINEKAGIFIKEKILPDLKNGLLKLTDKKLDFRISGEDSQVINFYYPKLYSSESILQFVRLEIGPLASLIPSEYIRIKPYIAEVSNDYFSFDSIKVLTLSPKRTFWEKATILHRESNRPLEKNMPQRYSRHYYDLYMISKSSYGKEAVDDRSLLEDVINFKKRFYRDNWSKYEEALSGKMKFSLPESNLKMLKEDYKKMQEMLYGNIPGFDEIMEHLKYLEKNINKKN